MLIVGMCIGVYTYTFVYLYEYLYMLFYLLFLLAKLIQWWVSLSTIIVFIQGQWKTHIFNFIYCINTCVICIDYICMFLLSFHFSCFTLYIFCVVMFISQYLVALIIMYYTVTEYSTYLSCITMNTQCIELGIIIPAAHGTNVCWMTSTNVFAPRSLWKSWHWRGPCVMALGRIHTHPIVPACFYMTEA